MPKVSTGTRVEKSVYERLERLAKVDRRSIANIVEICVEEYLPRLEEELSDKKAAILHEQPPAYKTSTNEKVAKAKH